MTVELAIVLSAVIIAILLSFVLIYIVKTRKGESIKAKFKNKLGEYNIDIGGTQNIGSALSNDDKELQKGPIQVTKPPYEVLSAHIEVKLAYGKNVRIKARRTLKILALEDGFNKYPLYHTSGDTTVMFERGVSEKYANAGVHKALSEFESYDGTADPNGHTLANHTIGVELSKSLNENEELEVIFETAPMLTYDEVRKGEPKLRHYYRYEFFVNSSNTAFEFRIPKGKESQLASARIQIKNHVRNVIADSGEIYPDFQEFTLEKKYGVGYIKEKDTYYLISCIIAKQMEVGSAIYLWWHVEPLQKNRD